jgi:single-strand DNA-binding protein
MVATVRGAAHERKVMDVASDNQIIIVGNLTDDPELRYTPNGAAVVKFRVAVNRRYRDEAGTWKDGDTSYFTVNAWRTLAENIAESLTRGTRVIVAGRLQMRSWETQEGDKRTVVEIEADEVGPSLRWATAKIERQGRSGDWSAPATVGAPQADEETPLDAD